MVFDRTERSARAAAAATALLIAIDAAMGRLLLTADPARVYVLGHPINWVCSFRSRLGYPCPGCGLTRSIVLTLHGDLATAWSLAPTGPIALFGALALAAGLLVFALAGGSRRTINPF